MSLSLGCQSGDEHAESKQISVAQTHEGENLTTFSEEITSATHEFRITAGGTHNLDVTVKNTGPQTWYGSEGRRMVDASCRWMDSKGNLVPMKGKRTMLNPPVVQPGESQSVKLQGVGPPNPGSYMLYVSMVQEGVQWFYAGGAKPLIFQVTVD